MNSLFQLQELFLGMLGNLFGFVSGLFREKIVHPRGGYILIQEWFIMATYLFDLNNIFCAMDIPSSPITYIDLLASRYPIHSHHNNSTQ
jgi:hypothetical protein